MSTDKSLGSLLSEFGLDSEGKPIKDKENRERSDEELQAMEDAIIGEMDPAKIKADMSASDIISAINASDGEEQRQVQHGFVPAEPQSFYEVGIGQLEIEAILLKTLLVFGEASGRELSKLIKLPFVMVEKMLRALKQAQVVTHKQSAVVNDYMFVLTERGGELARHYQYRNAYIGSTPVTLNDYIKSVALQSLSHKSPTIEDLRMAFGGLMLSRQVMDRLGPAINSARGLFLFGNPGNGKTSIAERVTAAFGETIWVPRAIYVAGEIIRVFDPINHIEVPLEESSGLISEQNVDRRWVRIKRPTIIAGGELTASQLEVTVNKSTGVSEAPLQMKSNCGTLVIDDFGRQKIPVEQLLNRWIIPLEKRFDFLNLPNGRKVQIPFDQLIIFSTNLEPRDLVDEAFLRRIPYKIEIKDPSEEEFRDLFVDLAAKMGFAFNQDALDYLIETHYKQIGRTFRFCHPRDLLRQIENYCAYHKCEKVMSRELFDIACDNYFAVM